MFVIILLVACGCLTYALVKSHEQVERKNEQCSHATEEARRSEWEAERKINEAKAEAQRDVQDAQDELEEYKSKLKRNMRKLHDSILDKFLHSNEAHGTIIDQEFEAWWKLWDGYEEDETDAKSGDGDDNDDGDDDDITLETVGELMRRLRRLPDSCDDYIVRFKTKDGDSWIQPEKCWIDDSGDIILGLYNDGETHSEFTVAVLYNILDALADNNSDLNGRPSVYDNMNVYILDCEYEAGSENEDGNNDKSYYQALDERFIILDGKQRVEIPMS